MTVSIPTIDGAESLASGFSFTEGPVWIAGEQRLIFSDIPGDAMHSWDERHGVTTFRSPSRKANGSTLDRSGRLVTCEHATSRVVRLEHDGRLAVLASEFRGARLNSPNDVVVAADDAVWFTDPDFGTTLPDMGVVRPRETDIAGVYRLDADTGTLDLVVADLGQPNGLCINDATRDLYVNDTATGLVHRYRLAGAGPQTIATDHRVWAEIPGDETGSVDGLKLDVAGNLYCTGPGGVLVFDPRGRQIALIAVPETVGNFAWGGVDGRTFFACASTSVYRLRVEIPGF